MSPRPTICACVITSGGDQVLARAVRNDETAVAAVFDAAAAHGSPALVIDTTSSTAALLMHAAAQRGLPVALRHRSGHAPRCGAVRRGRQDRPLKTPTCSRTTPCATRTGRGWVSLNDELLTGLQIPRRP